jgi:putative sterol carrier protein
MNIGAWTWIALALLSGASLGLGHPWTSLLSHNRFPDQVRRHPLFREANQVITAVWTAYFAVAGVVAALTGPWTSIALSVPTPLLGWLSFRVGDRYAPWKTRRSEQKGAIPMAAPALADLRAQISSKTDEEILDLIRDAPGGSLAVLDEITASMSDTFDPEAAQDCVIGYEIDSPDGLYACRIEIRGHDVRAEHRDPDDARVVLQLELTEYLRLVTGLVDGTESFMSGRMQIRGDVMFAPQVGRMFRTA